MSQSTDQKVAEVAAKHEAEAKAAELRARQRLTAQDQPEHEYDRWLRERREQDAKKAQEKSQQAAQIQFMTPETTAAWNAWFAQSLANLFEEHFKKHFIAWSNPVIEDIGKVLAKDRRVRLEEDEKVVTEVEGWVAGRLETKVLPRIETVEQRVAQQIGRADALAETVTAERAARESDVRTAIVDLKQWASERPETKLLERLEALEQRFTQYAGQTSGRIDALAEAIAAERAAREKDDDNMKHELVALAERMKAMPGRLPVAIDWKPQAVVYEGQFVRHEGSLFQARKDTAQPPGGGSDWLCVARAGRDAAMPTVRGTFNAYETYKKLDIVASDGGSFIARRDDPGILGNGDGWQLLARQGRPGRKGDPGPAGMRGERGEKSPATMPAIVSSKIEDFKLVVLREDKSLEIFDLRPAFVQYQHETSE